MIMPHKIVLCKISNPGHYKDLLHQWMKQDLRVEELKLISVAGEKEQLDKVFPNKKDITHYLGFFRRFINMETIRSFAHSEYKDNDNVQFFVLFDVDDIKSDGQEEI